MKPTYPQRHVYTRRDQVDVAVLENDVDIERRMLGEKDRKARHDVQAGKG